MTIDDPDRLLELVLERARDMGAEYADARFQDRRLTLIALEARRRATRGDDGAWEASRHIQRGLGLRVLLPGGAEGFAATTCFDRAALAKLVSDAVSGASSEGAAAGPGMGPPVVNVDEVATPRRVHPEDLDLDAKREILRTFRAEAFARPATEAVSLAYADASGTDLFASTEGSRVETDSARVVLNAEVTASSAPASFGSAESLGGVGGLELLAEPAVKGLAARLAGNAHDWLGAGDPPGGVMTAVLDNQACENFVHEAVGHSCEADAVLSGASVMAGRVGQRVGAAGVTVVDDPGRPGTVGMYPYDDEGVRARRVKLIEDGKLIEYLHSRPTAAAMDARPNGHARARDFGHRPIVRMGTINLEPGDFRVEEMLEDVSSGIYLMGKRGGQVNPAQGVFQFRPDRARLIEDGRLGAPVKPPSLSGSILDILTNIDAIGRDLCFHPGGCGKGFPAQIIPAGSGSPHVRLRRATIGGTKGPGGAGGTSGRGGRGGAEGRSD